MMPVRTALPYVYDDGGRAAAGYKGSTGDCVTRAISIAFSDGAEYKDAYALVEEANARYAATRRTKTAKRIQRVGPSPRHGSYREVYEPLLLDHFGCEWVSLMSIGTGTTHHLAAGELPEQGRLIASVSRHLTVIIDGVIHDTHDPSRDGTRAVYGYYLLP